MEDKNIPGCCNGCEAWKMHGNKCWYYWELKKSCTMHTEKIK